MSLLQSSILPRNFTRPDASIQASPRLTRSAAADQASMLAELQTSENGLGEAALTQLVKMWLVRKKMDLKAGSIRQS
jgi:hypothetical protein